MLRKRYILRRRDVFGSLQPHDLKTELENRVLPSVVQELTINLDYPFLPCLKPVSGYVSA